jgi:hypothetical protein
MAIFNLFSKRRKRECGEMPDVYQYTDVPVALRVQVVHIWKDAFGQSLDVILRNVEQTLCREYGVFVLGNWSHGTEAMTNFILHVKEVDRCLDVIEETFQFLYNCKGHYLGSRQSPAEAIDELNIRFREHGCGFQFESGKIVRLDSQIVHSEIVKPALHFLAEPQLKGANEEFLSAHEHYRHGKYKECLADCLKAFESVMKTICAKRKWTFREGDTAKILLSVLFQKGLIPSYMEGHFTGLRSVLEGGVPTLRNKLGGHGQGTSHISVPDSIAAFCLHLTAANILFLVRAEKEVP